MEIHTATSKFLMTNCACAHPWQSTRREIVLRGRSQTTLAQWCPFLTTYLPIYLLTYLLWSIGPGILMENPHTTDISRSTTGTYLPRLVSAVCEWPPKLVPSAHWLFNYLYVFVCSLLVIVVVLANGGWKIPSNRWRRVSFRIEQNYIENVSACTSKYSFLRFPFCSIARSEYISTRGFTKFGIKVLWRLQFSEYLRTLSL